MRFRRAYLKRGSGQQQFLDGRCLTRDMPLSSCPKRYRQVIGKRDSYQEQKKRLPTLKIKAKLPSMFWEQKNWWFSLTPWQLLNLFPLWGRNKDPSLNRAFYPFLTTYLSWLSPAPACQKWYPHSDEMQDFSPVSLHVSCTNSHTTRELGVVWLSGTTLAFSGTSHCISDCSNSALMCSKEMPLTLLLRAFSFYTLPKW